MLQGDCEIGSQLVAITRAWQTYRKAEMSREQLIGSVRRGWIFGRRLLRVKQTLPETMKSSATSVPEYIAEQPAERQKALTKVRSVIRKVAPDAKESMQYGMAAYDLNGMLCGFGAQKNHMALYVCEPEIVDAHRAALGRLNCGKGCIRFRSLDELPLDVISDILKDARAKRRAA